MKPPFATLTLLGSLLLTGAVGLWGQELPRLAIEPAKTPIDPFDSKFRRVLTGLDADLELLRQPKYGLSTTTEALVAYFRKRTLADADRPKIAALVQQLGSPVFRLREKATDDLLKFGPAILEFLRHRTKDDDLELIRRAEACAERIREAEPPVEVTAAALRVLASRQPPELTPVLLGYLPYAGSEYLTEEIGAALRAAARKEAHPDLIAALSDALPLRRAAAGDALAGSAERALAVKRLLSDPEPFVRLRVARAFIWAGDKSAVPVLIDTLPLVPAAQAWIGEETLLRLAEAHNPPMAPRGNEAARKKYKDAWLAWWAKNEKQVDLGKLHEAPKLLGHTVIVLLDLGRILELNTKNEVLWQIDNVIFPLDVQVLPSGNVLIAEHKANLVTERDRATGEIQWEKSVTGPLMAQRLPNRHTFVATISQLLEFDEHGNEVMSHIMPAGERLMKVAKLPNGDVVAMTMEAAIVRMDDKGKELSRFEISPTGLSGGRLDVLPNGHVLVPHYAEDKVIEYDTNGQKVMQFSVVEPVAATRLPNGNTLVTTYPREVGAVEFDRNGQETDWSFREANLRSKVTRAIRR